jgi:hypothetical protein
VASIVRCGQHLARPIQHQGGLLISQFDRYKAHRWACHRPRICGVRLIPLEVRLNVCRCHETHLVAKRDQLASSGPTSSIATRISGCRGGHPIDGRLATSAERDLVPLAAAYPRGARNLAPRLQPHFITPVSLCH